jgi:hypothetical protein
MSTVGPTNIRNSYNAAGGPAAYRIYRIFSMFDDTGLNNPDNRVNVIHGLPGNPWALSLTSGSVRNYTTYTYTSGEGHYNVAPPSSSAGENADRGWETWATIGLQFGTNVATFTPGAHAPDQLNNFISDFSADDAALLITPDDTQGRAIALNNTAAAGQGHTGFGVLLMQITVTPSSNFNGQFNLNIGGPGSTQDVLGLTFGAVPAPGGLALLGIAGLIGTRRRRG